MVFELLLFLNCISLRISQECLYLLCILFYFYSNHNFCHIRIVRYRNFNYHFNKRTNKELLIVKKK